MNRRRWVRSSAVFRQRNAVLAASLWLLVAVSLLVDLARTPAARFLGA